MTTELELPTAREQTLARYPDADVRPRRPTNAS